MSIIDNTINNDSNNETWLSNIRNILRRNQGFVNAFQYIAGTVAVFLPSHFRYSEIFSEGVYSLSRLVSLLNRTLLDGSLESLNGLEPLLRFITKGFATIEVLLEKMSQSLIGPIQRYTAILIIESSKTLCRLMILVERRRPSMLIDWGKSDENSPIDTSSSSSSSFLDLNHYESWYKVLYNFEIDEHYKKYNHNNRYSSRNSRNNSNTDPVFYTPLARIMARTTRSDSFTENEVAMGIDDVEIEPFVGKRSGMKLFVDMTGFQRKIDAISGKNDSNNKNTNNNVVSNHMAILSQSSNDTEEDDPNFNLGKDVEHLDCSSKSGSISSCPMNTPERRHRSDQIWGHGREESKDPETPELAGGKASDSDYPYIRDIDNNNYNYSNHNHNTNNNHNNYNKYHIMSKHEDVVLDNFGASDANNMTQVNSHDDNDNINIYNGKSMASIHGRKGDINSSNMKVSRIRRSNKSKVEMVVDDIESGLGGAATATSTATITTTTVTENNKTTVDPSHTITTTESSTLSPETFLVLGEILHVTRPTVYAMIARHLLGQSWAGPMIAQDPRFEAREAAADTTAAATNHTSSSTNNPNPNYTNSTNSHTNNTSIDPEDGNPFGFSRYSTTTILRMKVFAVALLGSLIVEVSSVLATQRALTLTRERAMKQLPNNNNSNSNSDVPILDLSKMHLEASSLRPHSFDKELRRRKLAILLYLIRTPLFDVATLPAMRAISRAIANVPLVGGIPDYIVGVVRYLNASHFYNSGSS